MTCGAGSRTAVCPRARSGCSPRPGRSWSASWRWPRAPTSDKAEAHPRRGSRRGLLTVSRFSRRTVVALVPAAGRGARLGVSTPKAFVELGGVPMVRRAVDGLLCLGSGRRGRGRGRRRNWSSAAPPASGRESRRRGRWRRAHRRSARRWPPRPTRGSSWCTTPPGRSTRPTRRPRGRRTARGRDAVVPVIPVVDTMKSVDVRGGVTGTPDRAELRAGADAAGLRRGPAPARPMPRRRRCRDHRRRRPGRTHRRAGAHALPGDPHAFKITTPLDLTLAEALLAAD